MALTAAQQAAVNRLASYYEGNNAYNAQTNPGGFQQGGHRVNFVPALQDTASAVQGAASLIADALAAAANSPKAVRVDSQLNFSAAEMLQGLANLGLLSVYLGMTPAQQFAFRQNIGAASNDDFRQSEMYAARREGKALGFLGGMADDFQDLSGVDTANSLNVTLQNGTILNQASDPNTKVLLHGDTNFTDSAGHTFAVSGAASISTAQSVFGGASMAFLNSGDFITSTSADYALGTGDFSYEFRVRFNSVTGPQYMVDGRDSTGANGFAIFLNTNKVIQIDFGATNVTASGTTLAANTWYAIQVSRASGTVRLFINGNLDASATSNASITSQQLRIGSDRTGAGLLLGYVDEFRLSNIARNTVAYTPAASAFSGGSSGLLDLKSAAFSASAVPTKASMWALIKPVAGSIIVGSSPNLIASVTRTGSFADATNFPLALVGTVAGSPLYRADNFDISGQPQGSIMKHRFQTNDNALGIALDAVVMQWG